MAIRANTTVWDERSPIEWTGKLFNLFGSNSPPLGAYTFAVVFGFDTPLLAAGLFILCSNLKFIFVELVCVVGGRPVLNCGMSPNAIVEHLDVIEYNLLCLITGFKLIVMQAFCFERAKETFHGPGPRPPRRPAPWRVVPAVAFSTHGVAYGVA